MREYISFCGIFITKNSPVWRYCKTEVVRSRSKYRVYPLVVAKDRDTTVFAEAGNCHCCTYCPTDKLPCKENLTDKVDNVVTNYFQLLKAKLHLNEYYHKLN